MSARIWIVDDDHAVRFVLATALREAGHAVDGFGNAADALDALRDAARPTCCSPTCACPATTA
jgi:two-component system, NtrC family, nitrogen regulation response regulator GlnG